MSKREPRSPSQTGRGFLALQAGTSAWNFSEDLKWPEMCRRLFPTPKGTGVILEYTPLKRQILKMLDVGRARKHLYKTVFLRHDEFQPETLHGFNVPPPGDP